MKVEKNNLLQLPLSIFEKHYFLYETFKQLLKENTTSFIIFKVFLIIFLLFIITIIVNKYTSFVDFSTNEKIQIMKEEKVKHFIDYYVNTEGFDTGKKNTENPPEMLWETDTVPFSFNKVNIFQKNYGFLDETNDNIENYQEGFVNEFTNFFTKTIPGGFEKAGNTIKDETVGVIDKLKIIGNDITNGFNEVTNTANNVFNTLTTVKTEIDKAIEWLNNIDDWVNNKIIKPTKAFFDGITAEFANIKRRFTMFGWGLKDLFTAIGNTFVTLWNAIETEFKNVGNLIVGGGKCSVHFINNFRSCLLYYLFDAFVSIIYHLFMLIPWLIDSFGRTKIVDQIKKVYTYIEKLDSIIKKMVGVSFLHYPKMVIDTCYSCKEVNFSELVKQLYDDNTKIERAFVNLGGQYSHAADTLKQAFT